MGSEITGDQPLSNVDEKKETRFLSLADNYDYDDINPSYND